MCKDCTHRYQYVVDADISIENDFGITIRKKGVIVRCPVCCEQKQMTLDEWNKYKKEKYT